MSYEILNTPNAVYWDKPNKPVTKVTRMKDRINQLRAARIGCQEAKKINASIDALLQEFPVDEADNPYFWIAFVQTVTNKLNEIVTVESPDDESLFP